MQKDYDVYILFIVGVVVAGAIYFGVITAVKKSFKPTANLHALNSAETRAQQERRIDDIQRRQKNLMRNHRQKMRDFKRTR